MTGLNEKIQSRLKVNSPLLFGIGTGFTAGGLIFIPFLLIVGAIVWFQVAMTVIGLAALAYLRFGRSRYMVRAKLRIGSDEVDLTDAGERGYVFRHEAEHLRRGMETNINNDPDMTRHLNEISAERKQEVRIIMEVENA